MEQFSQKIEFSQEDQTFLKETTKEIVHNNSKKAWEILYTIITILMVVIFFPIAVFLIIFGIIKNEKDKENMKNKKIASYADIVTYVLQKRIPEAGFYLRQSSLNPRDLIEKDVLPTGNVSHTFWEFNATKSETYSCAISRINVNNEEIWRDKTGKPHRTKEKIFSGIALKIKLKKKTKCPIKIVASEKKFSKESVGKYTPKTEGWKKIEIESIKFNEGFEVYAETEVGAFQTMDATLVEKMLKLKEKYGIFGCYIDEDNLYFAFKNKKDLFPEPKKRRAIKKIKLEEIDKNIIDLFNIVVDIYNTVN